MAATKQELGQFYTTNYKRIMTDFNIPKSETIIIEPFAGNGDLVNYIHEYCTENGFRPTIECYDIEPKQKYIIQRDTLNDPPEYNDKFVITNPPYLARNKSKDKTIFDKYNQNDLYKCFLINLINGKCRGGIIIIPLNFWCSIRKSDVDLRKKFLTIFVIQLLNIFEEKVFDDTSYTVCSFQFINKEILTTKTDNSNNIPCVIYPVKQSILIKLDNTNNFTIGGEIYSLPKRDNITVERLTKFNSNSEYKTNILVKCIDDNKNSMIRMIRVDDKDVYIDKSANLSARSYATLVIQPKLNHDQQDVLVGKFNSYLNEMRKKYNSLFLANYRESNSIARKRISFSLVFDITNYLLADMSNATH
jgi:hypothetical protein